MNYETVVHTIPPLFAPDSRVLMLGSIPSPKSREVGFFYGHPQNRYWRVLAAILGEDAPQSIAEKRAMCLRHGIAMWDVLASCEIVGAGDSTIRNPMPNDLAGLVAKTQVRAVFATGQKAAALYRKYCERQTGLPVTALPSTSPANAAWTFERLCEAYRVILPYL
ncbi:MAG: DNA-deoxyinosine glycosylase [Intestinibacillus sp.]